MQIKMEKISRNSEEKTKNIKKIEKIVQTLQRQETRPRFCVSRTEIAQSWMRFIYLAGIAGGE